MSRHHRRKRKAKSRQRAQPPINSEAATHADTPPPEPPERSERGDRPRRDCPDNQIAPPRLPRRDCPDNRVMLEPSTPSRPRQSCPDGRVLPTDPPAASTAPIADADATAETGCTEPDRANLEMLLHTAPQHNYDTLSLRTGTDPEQKYQIPLTEYGDNISFELLIFTDLRGTSDFLTAEHIFFLNQANINLKQLRIVMDNRSIITEPGQIHAFRGDIELESVLTPLTDGKVDNGFRGLGRAFMRAITARESLFQNRLTGTGVIYLEPSFKHFFLLRLEDEALIFDRGTFICCEGTLSVTAVMQRTWSAALFGKEGLFQTKIEGTGIAMFRIPCQLTEIRRYDLVNERLCLDGGYAVARSASLQYSASLSGKGLTQTVTSGELLLQTFTGTGSVWVAPTMNVYRDIESYHSKAVKRPFKVF